MDKNIIEIATIGILILIFLLIFTIPLSPENNVITDVRNPRFTWLGLAPNYTLFIDEDPGFASPIEIAVTGNSYTLKQPLDFDTYYWKIDNGITNTSPMTFTVVSTIKVRRNETGLKNEGNVDILIEKITGAFILKINETIDVEVNENVTARQV